MLKTATRPIALRGLYTIAIPALASAGARRPRNPRRTCPPLPKRSTSSRVSAASTRCGCCSRAACRWRPAARCRPRRRAHSRSARACCCTADAGRRRAAGAGNALTLARMGMIAALAPLCLQPPGPVAALLVFAIFALDGVDGWLARKHGQASLFGAHLDMECDALLVLLCALVLYQHGRLGAFILVPGLLALSGYVVLPAARAFGRWRSAALEPRALRLLDHGGEPRRQPVAATLPRALRPIRQPHHHRQLRPVALLRSSRGSHGQLDVRARGLR